MTDSMRQWIKEGARDFSGIVFLELVGDRLGYPDDVTFKGATLIKAEFGFTRLIGADFSDSTLWDADFTKANLTRASFARARLDHADFTLATLAHADLTGATAEDADFFRADLSGASLAGGCFPGANFSEVTASPETRLFADPANADSPERVSFAARWQGVKGITWLLDQLAPEQANLARGLLGLKPVVVSLADWRVRRKANINPALVI